VRLSTIREKVNTITVTWQGETVDVGYFPAAMTPDLAASISRQARAATAAAKAAEASGEAVEDDGGLDLLAAMLSPLIAWWDLYEDEQAERDQRRMPTDAATIGRLPVDFTMAIQTAIQEDMKPEGSKG
jgi:hypothetical protein